MTLLCYNKGCGLNFEPDKNKDGKWSFLLNSQSCLGSICVKRTYKLVLLSLIKCWWFDFLGQGLNVLFFCSFWAKKVKRWIIYKLDFGLFFSQILKKKTLLFRLLTTTISISLWDKVYLCFYFEKMPLWPKFFGINIQFDVKFGFDQNNSWPKDKLCRVQVTKDQFKCLS